MIRYILLFTFLLFSNLTFAQSSNDDNFILSKIDTKQMFETSAEEWIQNIQYLKSIGQALDMGTDNSLPLYSPLYIDMGNSVLQVNPTYLDKNEPPTLILVEIIYRLNFIDEFQFDKILQKAKQELSPEYKVDGNFILANGQFPTLTFLITQN